MNRSTKYVGAVVFSLAIVVSASADEKLIEKKDREPANDKEFIAHALACEIAEIKFAEQALKTSKNDDVRKFATRLITDHTKTRDALTERAREMKLAVLEGMDKEKREKLDSLSKLEGSQFNRDFMSCMIEGHEKALKTWEKWSREAKDENLRDLAKRTIPVVKEHLEMARDISKNLKD